MTNLQEECVWCHIIYCDLRVLGSALVASGSACTVSVPATTVFWWVENRWTRFGVRWCCKVHVIAASSCGETRLSGGIIWWMWIVSSQSFSRSWSVGWTGCKTPSRHMSCFSFCGREQKHPNSYTVILQSTWRFVPTLKKFLWSILKMSRSQEWQMEIPET